MAKSLVWLRERVVAAYRSGRCTTYEGTAAMFGIGRASVSRWLRRERLGTLTVDRPKGHRPQAVDRTWLAAQKERDPDTRLVDLCAAWLAETGVEVCTGTMSNHLRAIGWTHKKRRRSPASGTARQTKRTDARSLQRKATSRRAN